MLAYAAVRHRGRLSDFENLSQLVLSPDNLLRLEIKSMRVVSVAWKFVETVVGDALSVASTVFNAEVAIFMGGSKMDSAFLRGIGESFPLTAVFTAVLYATVEYPLLTSTTYNAARPTARPYGFHIKLPV